MQHDEWFLEVFTEKLPVNCQTDQESNVRKKISTIDYVDIHDLWVQCGPHRFVVYLGFNKKRRYIRGPRADVSDTILCRFCEKHSLSSKDLEKRCHDNGNTYWFFQEYISDIDLNRLLFNAVLQIEWPEYMSWNGLFRWPRPIRNICLLFNNQHMEIDNHDCGLIVSDSSRLSAYTSDVFKVINFSQYKNTLKNKDIMIDLDERQAAIQAELKHLIGISSKNSSIAQRFAKFSEVPIVFTQTNDLSCLEEELLAFCINEDCIAYHDKKFICCIDGSLSCLSGDARYGFDLSIRSKLKEIERLWDYDIAIPIDMYRKELSEMTVFGGRLGSYLDRGSRIAEILSCIDHKIDDTELCDIGECMNIAQEFDDIYLLSGGLYLKKMGYLLGDRLLEIHRSLHENQILSVDAAILGIIMMVDRVIGLLGAGIEVKGSSDQFGIKKLGNFVAHANQVAKVDLDRISQRCIDIYRKQGIIIQANTQELFDDFIRRRLMWIYQLASEKYYRYLAYDVMKSGYAMHIIDSIHECIDKFEGLISMYRRIKGLLKVYNFDESKISSDHTTDIIEHQKMQIIMKGLDRYSVSELHKLMLSMISVLDNVFISDLDLKTRNTVLSDLCRCLIQIDSVFNLD